jgi:hypothetical protein
MAKNFFSLNPFRRKKRQPWKKGGEAEEPESSEAEAPEPADASEAGALEEVTLEEPEEIDIGAVEAETPAAAVIEEKPPAPVSAGVEPFDFDFGGEEPPAAPAKKLEPPTAVLPAETGKPGGGGEEIRSVRDSVESLRRHAMTAGQLRETIERTIEARLTSVKDVVARVQQLFKEGIGAKGAGVDVEPSIAALGERLEGIRSLVEQVQSDRAGFVNDVKASLRADGAHLRSGIEADLKAAAEGIKQDLERVSAGLRELEAKLGKPVDGEAIAGQLRLQEERVVAWLERLNVGADREARKAEEDHAALRSLFTEFLRDRAEMGQLRSQLNRIRGNLSAGLQEAREELWRSFLGRSFLKGRLESAIQPADTALLELDALLKKLAEK